VIRLTLLLVVSAATGGWIGWRVACTWYEELGAEPPNRPVKTYAQSVGRQDCEKRGWECMTGADKASDRREEAPACSR